MVTRPTADGRKEQAAAQETHHHSAAMHAAGELAGADAGAAELPASAQLGMASPQQAQQAAGQMSAPMNLPPSMVRIAAALPPVQQQVMVCLAASPDTLVDDSLNLLRCTLLSFLDSHHSTPDIVVFTHPRRIKPACCTADAANGAGHAEADAHAASGRRRAPSGLLWGAPQCHAAAPPGPTGTALLLRHLSCESHESILRLTCHRYRQTNLLRACSCCSAASLLNFAVYVCYLC